MRFAFPNDHRRRSAAHAVLRGRIRADLIQALALSDDDALSIDEIACSDPGCPDLETVVLVMRAGERTRAIKLTKPLSELGPGDYELVVETERARRISDLL